MVKLINGRGQLGDALSNVEFLDIDCSIYHTWNIEDPAEHIQRKEYDKLVDFVDRHLDEKIFFISTKQGRAEHYLHYKLLAELYILEAARFGYIIRIPKLIGKGMCADFRDNKILPYDELEEIITPEDAALQIMDILPEEKKMNIITGSVLNKRIIYSLIQYGAGNEY